MASGTRFLLTLLTWLAFAGNANAASLTNESLVGNWVVNEGKCTDTNAEFLVFRKNGAAESMHNGKLDALGFWTLSDDNISVDVLAPPSFFEDVEESRQPVGDLLARCALPL